MEDNLVSEKVPLDDHLSMLVEWCESSEEATAEYRKSAERNRDYKDNKQLTPAELATLRKRGQPPVISNRIKRKIDYLLGTEVNQRTDPKAYPRTPQHEQDAQSVSDALRFVCDEGKFNKARSKVWENMLIEGCAAAEVIVEEGGKRPKIRINHIPWDRFIFDPYSREDDFTDSRYMGIVLWLDFDVAKRMWPQAVDKIEWTLTSTNFQDTYDDRPKHTVWSDRKRKRVKIIVLYYQYEGEWLYAEFTKCGFLSKPILSPYLDDEGRPDCAIIATVAYRDRENNPYGIVDEMISPQDEINKRRSKALHLLSNRQVIAENGAVENKAVARQELAKADGYIEVRTGSRFEIQQTVDLAQGQVNLLQEAKNEIDLLGPNAAMSGKQNGAPSGRAINLMQQGGMIELGPLVDNRRQWDHRIYRAAWNRVRQFWDQETWIRVTDNEQNIKFVGFNVPMKDEFDQAILDQFGQPKLQNPISEIDVDIMLEDVPDVVNLQGEVFDGLVNLARSGVQIPPDVLIEASPLPNKAALLKRMRDPTTMQAQQQQAQQQQEIAAVGMQSKIQETQARTRKTNADAEQTELETVVKRAATASPPLQFIQ